MDEDICPICKNTGCEEYEKNGYTYYRQCKCGITQRQITNDRLSFANIPASFQGMRLSQFDVNMYSKTESQNRAINAVKAVNYWLNMFENMNDRGIGLYLHSQAKGSGKTRMAASIANELIYVKHIQVKFATSLQILNEIKKTWDKRDSKYTENKLLDFLSTTEVLIVDDFGMEQEGKEKAWINDRFYHIINSRYIDKKITIFTSNMSLDNLQYDDRITDRIKERTFQVPFPEESIRNIIAKNNMREIINAIKG